MGNAYLNASRSLSRTFLQTDALIANEKHTSMVALPYAFISNLLLAGTIERSQVRFGSCLRPEGG
jgi:hypothetical protein